MEDPAVTLPLVLGVAICGLVTILVLYYNSHWRGLSDARIPKGSFGWPVIGETFAFTRDPNGYCVSHRKRYGSIFRSSLFLRKTILGTTPEFVKFVITNPALFKFQFPVDTVFVPSSVTYDDGPRRESIKKLFLHLNLPDSLRSMVQSLENIILENLALWEEQDTVFVGTMSEKLFSETSSYIALGIENINGTAGGREALPNLIKLFAAFIALPIKLPGTTYTKAIKAMSALRVYLKSNLQQQRMSEDGKVAGMVGILLEAERKNAKYLNEDVIVDQMLSAWTGSFKTTATTMIHSVKLLADYPDIFSRIQAEQQQILKEKGQSAAESRLTFDDTRKMVYTLKFLQEVDRVVSMAGFLARKATQDVMYDGFLIPKGWAVLAMSIYVHKSDPVSHKDPEKFNPDRFNSTPTPWTYMPFGMGIHRCPGEEVSKLEMLVFLHHFTTKYKFERVGRDQGVKQQSGFPTVIGGLPIKLTPMY